MLVLSRKKDEIITIGDNIRIMVVSTGNKFVRLGIQAPPEIPVHRLEIYELIHADKNVEDARTEECPSVRDNP